MFSREWAIDILTNRPNEKITHRLFDTNEYLYSKENGLVYDENGCLFEDWTSEGMHNGLRIRIGNSWENGWNIYREL